MAYTNIVIGLLCDKFAFFEYTIKRYSRNLGGVGLGKNQFTVAFAGNPNVGKSTVFNNLTGLNQHTGNWIC